jgi:hypothetical protein
MEKGYFSVNIPMCKSNGVTSQKIVTDMGFNGNEECVG